MVLVPCAMCKLPVEENRLMAHVVAVHRMEANFKVYCIYCGASYTNWKSFCTHLRRKHKDEQEQQNLHADGGHDDQQNVGPVDPMEIDEPEENTDLRNQDRGPQDPEAPMLDFSEWQAMTIFGSLQEEKMLPKNTAEEIVYDVSEVIHQRIAHLKEALTQGLQEGQTNISLEHISEVFENALDTKSFLGPVLNSNVHEQYLKQHCQLILAEPTVIGQIRSWSPEGRIVTHDAVAYVVPFLEDLETLLNNRDLLACVENPRPHILGEYASLLDGSSYLNHPVYLRNPKALSIIIYYDDVEFCNPLGSKKRKFGMFYYILGNIYPELRSTLRVINLLAIVESQTLKRFGVKKVLEPFINDINMLSKGLNLIINGQEKYFSGFLQGVAGDTPADNFLAGFKEGVGGAFRPCRRCLVTKDQLSEVCLESQIVLRDKETHQRYLARVTNPLLTKANKKRWSRLYGVNERSCLAEVENFDVTKGFPQDFMHVVIEGTLEGTIRNFISHCVEKESPLFTLDNLNTALCTFKYGHLVKDKPSTIEPQHLQNGLKQSAAQLMALAFVLPFAVYQWIDESVEDHVRNIIVLGQIVNLSLAFKLTSQEITLLKKMIQVYIVTFVHLYPNAPATPKLHFMIHLPEQIKEFGPLRQHWCFRFEAEHQYFKRLASKVRNFKNLAKTFSERRQKLKCVQLASPNNDGSKTFLYHGDIIKAGKSVDVRQHPFRHIMVDHPIPPLYGLVMSSPSVTVHGTTYRKGSVLLLADLEDDLPQFGLVEENVIFERSIFLRYVQLKTKSYKEKLNAYLVVKIAPVVNGLVNVRDLPHPHPLSLFQCVSKTFVVLMYHKRCEFTG